MRGTQLSRLFSLAPAIEKIRWRIGRPVPDLERSAVEQWLIAPSSRVFVRPAIFIKDHLERITGTDSTPVADVVRRFQGNYEAVEHETLAFRLKNVDLVDGVLYGDNSSRHLAKRSRLRFAYRSPAVSFTGAMYESWIGNRWFGNWLADDCLTYRLAERFGTPLTGRIDPKGHVPDYEKRAGMGPVRLASVHFDELVIFRDEANNEGKIQRAREFRRMAQGGKSYARHAGVFLLRGSTGDRRILLNEMEIAQALVRTRGFKVLDPSTASVDEIAAVCGGAQVVAGVEGSHLVHGQVLMPDDATLFVIQPPGRVTAALKVFTDRVGQAYSFVVGVGGNSEFRAVWSEIERTLDLLLR